MNEVASQGTVISVLRQSLQSDNVKIIKQSNFNHNFFLVTSFIVLRSTGYRKDLNHPRISPRIIRSHPLPIAYFRIKRIG